MHIQGAYEDIYTSTGVAFAQSEQAAMKQRFANIEVKDLRGVWRDHMANFVKTRCGNKIEATIRTMFDDIEIITRAVIAQGAESGWGATRVGKEISKRLGLLDDYRAMRIARTEVVGASNEGSFMGAGSTGIKTIKTWIATFDGNTRDDHAAIHNTSVGYTDKFTVGDSELTYPGDPDGEPGQVINCRCACSYEPETSYIDQLLNE